MKTVIRNATIVNPNRIVKGDILIQRDTIAKIAPRIRERSDKEIDAAGKLVFPGFIDMHAHFRTPGREDEEDLLSGSLAAAKGGFTQVCCMPNTDPAIDNESLAAWIVEEGRKIGIIEIIPVGAITKGRKGEELTEFLALKKAGCLTVSEDGASLKDSLLLRRALEYSRMTGLLVVSHCEDARLAAGGSIRESIVASKYGISAIPSIAESLIVARDVEMARYLDVAIHIAHVSTVRSLEIIRRAKKEGVKVTCETCPHYFSLTIEDVEENGFIGNYKVNPPLGDKKDLEAVKRALKDGTIDCIATDHAPHSLAEKELPLEDAPFGFTGLELAFAVTNTYLVKNKIIDYRVLAQKFAYNPAKILKLADCGKIQEGFKASLAVIDPEKTFVVTEAALVSKSKNTPFLNRELSGVVEITLNRGRVVYNSSNAE